MRRAVLGNQPLPATSGTTPVNSITLPEDSIGGCTIGSAVEKCFSSPLKGTRIHDVIRLLVLISTCRHAIASGTRRQ
jgi:hypothetical protein